jgi:hypothetical protein
VRDLLPASGLQLSPDAVHPPFSWQVVLPSDWAFLDTHPARWRRSLERLVDDRLAGRRLKTAERREVLRVLSDLVADCQRAGALISLVHVGLLSTGGVATAGLHVAWYDSAPDLASLATVRQAIGRQGTVEEAETPAGTVLMHRDHVSVAPPGSADRKGLASLQAFLPLPARTWTAIVATAGAHPELTPMLHELVVTVASGIRVLDEEPPPVVPGPDDESRATWVPVAQTPAPGVLRGFGTLVAHRIDAEQPDEG